MTSIHELSAEAAKELEKRRELDLRLRQTDIVDWAHSNFYIPETQSPIPLAPHQQGPLRFSFRRLAAEDPRILLFPSLAGRIGHFPFTTVILSKVKKGGKTTESAVIARFMAETQTRFGEIYCCGNDWDQAAGRAFKFVGESIRLTPGCIQKSGDWILPHQYVVQKTKVECLSTGTIVKPVSVDARGEAGGNPDLTIWTELWGFYTKEALLFWDEMTPVPTKIDSIRLVETYAGFEGESGLLESLYNLGLAGRQLTAGELSTSTDTPLDAFEETRGDPAAPVPVWVNEAAGLFMLWDSGTQARRMPWQRGDRGAAYYREREKSETPIEFSRHHLNEWVGSESEFVPIVLWDACQQALPPFNPGDRTPCVLAVDAATTGDCFGVVAVTRRPGAPQDPAIRAVRRWDPAESGGLIEYEEPEAFLRFIALGGCGAGHPLTPKRDGIDERFSPKAEGNFICPACRSGDWLPRFNVVQIAYDPFQLVDMMQRLTKESVAWCEPFNQGQDRLIADRQLYDLIISRRLAHDGNAYLREHVQNSKAKHQKDQDSTLRIVKKSDNRKIDLAVAASMGAARCLELHLENMVFS